jgi:hypothetical protein
MSRIYIKEFSLNNKYVVFEKKYIKINNYLIKSDILPNDLINIIMEYINHTYTINYCKFVGDFYSIKNLINDSNNKYLLEDIGINMMDDNTLISSTTKSFKVLNYLTKHKLDDHSTHNTAFFNYFMNKYYDKTNYIGNDSKWYIIHEGYLCDDEHINIKSEHINCNHTKKIEGYMAMICHKNFNWFITIEDYKEFKNMIVIIKIFIDMIKQKKI